MLDLWLSDPPSFQPSPKFKSQFTRSCCLSPGFQVNCCPWSSLTTSLNALAGWQCNAGDGCICVLIPRRFNYPLHIMCGWLYNEGSLFNHGHTVYYVSLMWQVAINSFFSFCWLLYPPSTFEFLGGKKSIYYMLFYSDYKCSKSPHYFWLFFCKEEYTVSLSILFLIFLLRWPIMWYKSRLFRYF